jgi:small subunit ribosomal protein S29
LSSAESVTDSKLSSFRTSESNPVNHGLQHEGRLYKMSDDDYEGVFKLGGFWAYQTDLFKLFNERCIMVRRPALEVIDYLKKTDFSLPVNRYVLCKKTDDKTHSIMSLFLLKY